MSIQTYMLAAASLLVVVFYQAAVTYRLLQSQPESDSRRTIQLCIIWFAPLLGAWIVNQVMKIDAEPIKPYDSSEEFRPEFGN